MGKQDIIDALEKDRWMTSKEVEDKVNQHAITILKKLRESGDVFWKHKKIGRWDKYIYKKKG